MKLRHGADWPRLAGPSTAPEPTLLIAAFLRARGRGPERLSVQQPPLLGNLRRLRARAHAQPPVEQRRAVADGLRRDPQPVRDRGRARAGGQQSRAGRGRAPACAPRAGAVASGASRAAARACRPRRGTRRSPPPSLRRSARAGASCSAANPRTPADRHSIIASGVGRLNTTTSSCASVPSASVQTASRSPSSRSQSTPTAAGTGGEKSVSCDCTSWPAATNTRSSPRRRSCARQTSATGGSFRMPQFNQRTTRSRICRANGCRRPGAC